VFGKRGLADVAGWFPIPVDATLVWLSIDYCQDLLLPWIQVFTCERAGDSPVVTDYIALLAAILTITLAVAFGDLDVSALRKQRPHCGSCLSVLSLDVSLKVRRPGLRGDFFAEGASLKPPDNLCNVICSVIIYSNAPSSASTTVFRHRCSVVSHKGSGLVLPTAVCAICVTRLLYTIGIFISLIRDFARYIYPSMKRTYARKKTAPRRRRAKPRQLATKAYVRRQANREVTRSLLPFNKAARSTAYDGAEIAGYLTGAVGQKIQLRSIKAKLLFKNPDLATATAWVRAIFIQWHPDNGVTVPTLADIIEDAAGATQFLSGYEIDERSKNQYTILRDFTVRLGSINTLDGTNQVLRVCNIYGKRLRKFRPTAANTGFNQIYHIIFGSVNFALAEPTVDVSAIVDANVEQFQ